MDFDSEDREIKKIFEPYRLKKPPASLTKGYEKQVLQKIRAGSPGPAFGWRGVLAGAAILALLGGLAFYWFLRPAWEEVQPSLLPVPATIVLSEKSEEALFDQMANDLFILEMLGEDEGLLDEFDRVAGDIEIWAQASPVG